MSGCLTILILEDVPSDAALVEDELAEAGIRFVSRCVATRADFTAALEGFRPDVILSDYSLPAFNGLEALGIAKARLPDTPFIFVTGALGEERAVDLLKEGATDYVLKDRLARLAPAVLRARREGSERDERRRIAAALAESEQRYRTIFENNATPTVIVARDQRIVLANRQFERLSGFPREEIEGRKRWADFLCDRPLPETADSQTPERTPDNAPLVGCEARIVDRDGVVHAVLVHRAEIGSPGTVVISLLDISGFRQLEREKRDSFLYARSLIEASLDPLVTVDTDGQVADVNRAMELITGFSRQELLGGRFADYCTDPEMAERGYRMVLANGFVRDHPLAIWHVSGRVTAVHYNASLLRTDTGGIRGVFAVLRDVTERMVSEERLVASNELLRSLTWDLVMTEERERRRIAVELHDHVGQTMALTKMKLDTFREQAARDDGLADPLDEIGELLNESIRQTRTLMRDISPAVLYELGFGEAVTWLGEQYQAQHGLRVVLQNHLKGGRIDQQVQLLLFRAIRELLMNVVKHARAKEASVVLKREGANIVVTVRDDGVGLDGAAIDRTKNRAGGFGLLSIRERIRFIGGQFAIERRDGEGAGIRLVVPQKSGGRKRGRAVSDESQSLAGR